VKLDADREAAHAALCADADRRQVIRLPNGYMREKRNGTWYARAWCFLWEKTDFVTRFEAEHWVAFAPAVAGMLKALSAWYFHAMDERAALARVARCPGARFPGEHRATNQGDPTMMTRVTTDTHPCPSCGGDLITERPGASLRCATCPWHLLTRAEWRTLDPREQGFVLYMQGDWPTSELKHERNPYPSGSDKWNAFRIGEQQAVQAAQDGEE